MVGKSSVLWLKAVHFKSLALSNTVHGQMKERGALQLMETIVYTTCTWLCFCVYIGGCIPIKKKVKFLPRCSVKPWHRLNIWKMLYETEGTGRGRVMSREGNYHHHQACSTRNCT